MRVISHVLALIAGIAAGWLLFSDRGDGGIRSEPEVVGGASATGAREIAGGGAPAELADVEGLSGLLGEAYASGTTDYASIKALMVALSGLSARTLPEFRAFFREQPFRKEQGMLWRLFFSAWGAFDPEGAMAFVRERFKEGAERRMFAASVFETWGKRSPGDALEFALGNVPAEEAAFDTGLAIEYLRELAGTDPEKALELAQRLHDGEFVLELTGRRIAELAGKDRALALDALENLTGELQIFAAAEFIAEWAKSEPSAAAQWLSKHYESRLGIHTLSQVAGSYVRADPEGALRWIAGLSDASMRESVFAEAMKVWAEVDATAAAKWLKQSAVRTENDEAVVALGNGLSASDPKAVIEEWVPRVADPQKGNALLYEVSLDWQRRHPAEYARWLENTSALPQEVKQRLLARELPGNGESGGNPPSGNGPAVILDQGR